MLGCSVDNIVQKPVNNPSVCGAFERIDQMDFSIEDLMQQINDYLVLSIKRAESKQFI